MGEFKLNSLQAEAAEDLCIFVCVDGPELSHIFPYPGVVETESEEWQLVVEVLVQLRIGGMNVFLVVTHLVIVGSLVKVPVHEVAADLLQSLRGDLVPRSIVTVRLGLFGGHAVLGVCGVM